MRHTYANTWRTLHKYYRIFSTTIIPGRIEPFGFYNSQFLHFEQTHTLNSRYLSSTVILEVTLDLFKSQERKLHYRCTIEKFFAFSIDEASTYDSSKAAGNNSAAQGGFIP